VTLMIIELTRSSTSLKRLEAKMGEEMVEMQIGEVDSNGR